MPASHAGNAGSNPAGVIKDNMKVYLPKIAGWTMEHPLGVYSSLEKALEVMAATCSVHEPGCRQMHHGHTVEEREVDSATGYAREYVWNESHTKLEEGYIDHDIRPKGWTPWNGLVDDGMRKNPYETR